MGKVATSQWLLGVRTEGGLIGRTENVQGSDTVLYDTVVDGAVTKPSYCSTPEMNPNVKYGCWKILMCQCVFEKYNKCVILEGDADHEGRYTFVGASLCLVFSFSANLKLLIKKSYSKKT